VRRVAHEHGRVVRFSEGQRDPRGADAEGTAGLALMVCSGELDRILAALVLATGAATMGQEVHVFCAFWASSMLRRADTRQTASKTWMDRLLGWLTPAGHGALGLSQLHFGGVGTAMMRARMRSKGMADCGELLAMAGQLGVKISVCGMTTDLLGLTLDDLVDYPGLEVCGVATFLAAAEKARTTLFI
jgi:peroxiredoxin family protein